jgi:hypothetical protein
VRYIGIVLLLSGLLAANLALAQSPFQSAPGPAAPPPRPRPAPQPALEPPPPAVTAPVVATPAPPPPEPPSLAGKWTAETNCPMGKTTELDVTPTGQGQYTIAIPNNSDYRGWISGTVQHADATGFFGDHISFNGTITSPTTMRGKTHLGFANLDCDWWATKN